VKSEDLLLERRPRLARASVLSTVSGGAPTASVKSAVRSQNLDLIHEIVGGQSLRVESQAPDTLAKAQPMHLNKDHAIVLIASHALLRRKFNEMMVVGKDSSPE
jgi:hypothetical protein